MNFYRRESIDALKELIIAPQYDGIFSLLLPICYLKLYIEKLNRSKAVDLIGSGEGTRTPDTRIMILNF